RHVPGEIHSANGVSIVVDVRGMESCFSTVFSRPLRPRPDQAHSGPVGVVVHLPGCAEDHLDVVFSKEVGRSVRPIHDLYVPFIRITWNGTGTRGQPPRPWGRGGCPLVPVLPLKHVACAERAAGMAAELTQNESRCAAQVWRNINAATNRDVRS